MECPLYRIAAVIRPGAYDEAAFECTKEKCAWWDTEFGICCIHGIESELSNIGDALWDIASNIQEGGRK